MRQRPGILNGSVMDSSLRVIGTVARLVLVAGSTGSGRVLRGLGEMTPPLKKCPDCYWLRIRRVGMLRIRVTSFDPAAPGKSLVHFKVLSVRQDDGKGTSARTKRSAIKRP
jgi:hypothetical protein